MPAGARHALPIIALRSPTPGPAAWFMTGIHGEEPAGPNAMAASVDALAELGGRYPVVVLPLCNPHGYARNWRYLNVAVYSREIDGQSVGDSSHLLLAPPPHQRARASVPSSEEADALTRYILRVSKQYPPRYSIDLHEDNLIHEGYVYSQGVDGIEDELAAEAVDILKENNIGIKMNGETRFEEEINAGIIGPVTDSSIDELMSAKQIWHNGRQADGPYAQTVLVFETPASNITIEQRIKAHTDLLHRLTKLMPTSAGKPVHDNLSDP
jgi:predicted deacylase